MLSPVTFNWHGFVEDKNGPCEISVRNMTVGSGNVINVTLGSITLFPTKRQAIALRDALDEFLRAEALKEITMETADAR